MTLQTSAEFERHLHNIFWREQYADGEGQRLLVAAIDAHVEAVRMDERRKTLLYCVKATCAECRKGVEVTCDPRGVTKDGGLADHRLWKHVYVDAGIESPCEAGRIRDLLYRLHETGKDGLPK